MSTKRDRAFWRKIAAETQRICFEGIYEAPSGALLEIGEAIYNAKNRTCEYPQDERITRTIPVTQSEATRFEVTLESTLAAARRLSPDRTSPRTLALVFASATHPGGGFMNGAMAQEESIAYASALWRCLKDGEMYPTSRGEKGNYLYRDWLILSEDVPVFRDDVGTLLETPWRVSLATSPAPNAAAYHAHHSNAQRVDKDVEAALKRRIERLLTLAECTSHHQLVLGAWGCGVFGCNPEMVARLFDEALHGPFKHSFTRVVFAIKEDELTHHNVWPFVQRFA